MISPSSPILALRDRRRRWSAGVLVLTALLIGCKGDRGKDGQNLVGGGDPVIGPGDDLPGVVINIATVTGGTGVNHNFRPGDLLSVNYTVSQNDGSKIDIAKLTTGSIMVSGPTFNYQRVIASQADLRTRSTLNGDGSYTYKFAVPLPSTYLEPLNDTATFTDGELTGQALLDGTYTVGIEARRDFKVGDETFRDAGNATAHFLVGAATTIAVREVVKLENCNQCHGELRAHGSNRNRIENCLLCHTAGAEDKNVATVADGTPDVTIDFKVMIHKIHAGATLPSVVGLTTRADGSRDYSVDAKPYRIVGFNNTVHDFSHVRFPAWPSLVSPTPRDAGYDTLSTTDKGKEDLVRSGPVNCAMCHGDPDGTGPVAPPAQGDVIYREPTRTACASCHDDWVPERPYTANTQTMPPQRDEAACTQCHRESGTPLDVRDAHLHPLANVGLAKGLNFTVTPPSTNLNPGDKLLVSFTVKDDAGADVPLSELSRIEVGVTGPTTNPNLVLSAALPIAGVPGSGPTYTTPLAERVYLEDVGPSSGSTLGTYTTARAPHWHVTGVLDEVFVRTGLGASTALAAAAPLRQNFLDVAPGTGVNFARNTYILIDAGTVGEEYMRIQYVEGDRLWFSSPRNAAYPLALTRAHAAGATVQVANTTAAPATSFTVDRTTGRITETVEFGAGTVLVSYTTDFVLPAVYPGTFNDSPDLDQAWGDWVGLSLASGTYTVGMWGSKPLTVTGFGQTTAYLETSRANANIATFLVGNATAKVPNRRIDSGATCNSCHVDLQFHGGNRRGYDSCLMCHGVAGAEDRAKHLAANAPATAGVSIDFRQMIHKIHAGNLLTKDYTVVGQGANAYPNNFSEFAYTEVAFPWLPGGVVHCVSCHGENNTAWKEPVVRAHPSQTKPVQVWRSACISCHDTDAVVAHAQANTAPNGGEACAICHGLGEEQHVQLKHKTR